MASATIKLFLPRGDAKSLRTAEISNWSGKAIAAPRTEFGELLGREELDRPGLYLLLGTDPESNEPRAYVGEAEVLAKRLQQHKTKEFWVTVIAFVSKDENLTKAHVRYLESRVLKEAMRIGRFVIDQNDAGGAKLPESDREDMEVFFGRVQQLLPVLGTDILSPAVQESVVASERRIILGCGVKNAVAKGHRSPNGFVVLKDSTAVLPLRPSASGWLKVLRDQLKAEGSLIEEGGVLRFAKDVEFASPSAAASIIQGGNTNGLTAWKSHDGVTLKDLDEQS